MPTKKLKKDGTTHVKMALLNKAIESLHQDYGTSAVIQIWCKVIIYFYSVPKHGSSLLGHNVTGSNPIVVCHRLLCTFLYTPYNVPYLYPILTCIVMLVVSYPI